MLSFPKPAPAAAATPSPRLAGELADWLAGALGAAAVRRADSEVETRDTVLRALAQRFYPCVPVSTQAARIHVLAETYAFVNWPRDRECTRLPPRYRDTSDEYLWAAFKSGAAMPLPPRELRRILIGTPDRA